MTRQDTAKTYHQGSSNAFPAGNLFLRARCRRHYFVPREGGVFDFLDSARRLAGRATRRTDPFLSACDVQAVATVV